MKIILITEDRDSYVRHAENLIKSLKEVFAEQGGANEIDSEIVIREKQPIGLILKKLSSFDAMLIFYDPTDISEALARSCATLAKWDQIKRRMFYISSCNKSYADIVQPLPNVVHMGIEHHAFMAKAIRKLYYDYEVQRAATAALGSIKDGPRRLSEEDYATPPDG